MKLYGISDLHVGFPANHRAVDNIEPHPEDWLIIAGDVGEKPAHLEDVFTRLGARFAQLIWTPGNHELWTHPQDSCQLRGQERYEHLVAVCRAHGVITPEDPYPRWSGAGGEHILVPMFLHYDYSFCPAGIPVERAVEWAQAGSTMCQDETFLDPTPHASSPAWCAARCEATEKRLAALPTDIPLVLINHNPLHPALCTLPRIPRFAIWSGTRRTADWHRRFNVAVMVSGHLHVRSTRWLEGVRCEEVSLGYPDQRRHGADINSFVREILPGGHGEGARRDRWWR